MYINAEVLFEACIVSAWMGRWRDEYLRTGIVDLEKQNGRIIHHETSPLSILIIVMASSRRWKPVWIFFWGLLCVFF